MSTLLAPTDAMEYLGSVVDFVGDDVEAGWGRVRVSDAEKRLREREALAYFAFTRWNFVGYVWYQREQFHVEVWRFRSRREVLSASSLRRLVMTACEKYGYD